MMAQDKSKSNGHSQKETGPVFNVHSVYLKDLSFEAPLSPKVFNEEWKPRINFDLQMSSEVISEAESVHEVVLHITVTVKLGEEKQEKTAFLVEVKQAGAFLIQDFSPDDVKQILATTCPTVLFPYAREIVSSLATRGGFPQMVLPPINFDAMYAKHLSDAESTENAGTA